MNVARSFNNWRKYRQTVTELGRMTSRELRDLTACRAPLTELGSQQDRNYRIDTGEQPTS
jgi:uncharacterized protein YjiS (DUF1127 family)